MTREEMNLIRGFVANIQSLKDAHINDNLPINYGMLCTITTKGWELLKELNALEQQSCEDADAVSRKAVFETFGEQLGVWGKRALMEMPSVQPESNMRIVPYDECAARMSYSLGYSTLHCLMFLENLRNLGFEVYEIKMKKR